MSAPGGLEGTSKRYRSSGPRVRAGTKRLREAIRGSG